MAYVIKTVRILKCKIKRMKVVISLELSPAEIGEAETLWVTVAQATLSKCNSDIL